MTPRPFLVVLLAILSGVTLWAGGSEAPAAPVELRAEGLENPVGLGGAPRFSWKLSSARRGAVQEGYRIQVSTTEDFATASVAWDSGATVSRDSIGVAYQGPALHSAERLYWRVQTKIGSEFSPWSAAQFFETGLLRADDWRAKWITFPGDNPDAAQRPPAIFRREFSLGKPIRAAGLYISSLGLYLARINGREVSRDVLAPGWTSYGTRVRYQTYDVTSLVASGQNALVVTVGDGWYRGHIGIERARNEYGNRTALIAQLELEFADGTRETVASDSTWKSGTGPIRFSEIYAGETYDARLAPAGWDRAGFDDAKWTDAKLVDWKPPALFASSAPPVRRIKELAPITVHTLKPGVSIVDFGQNLVGWVRIKLTAPAGTTVTLRHGELLDQNGGLYTGNLRNAAQTDRYTARGSGLETYEPHFTFHGFRYVEIKGWPGEIPRDALAAIVVHSDVTPTGEWESSDPFLNRLVQNIRWSQEGNFVDIPTDCPQRDEREGWTGDAAVFARTATYNFDCDAFFAKWLGDLAIDQEPDGKVPWVIPDNLRYHRTSAGWGDVAVIVPWTTYLAYGDRRVLETQYTSMKRWVDYCLAQTHGGLSSDTPFGDWLATVSTDMTLVATACLAHSLDLMARTAGVLGLGDDQAKYAARFEQTKQAFNHAFVAPDGKVGAGTQTAYALALRYELLPVNLRRTAADRLAADVVAHGDHLTTGFLGTPQLCPALAENGHLDRAYALLMQATYPSWLYPVTRGATTIWERWDGIRPDGTLQDGAMNSFNHYAYGAIGEWLYSTVAGIDADSRAPGYRKVVLRPRPGGTLQWVKASLRTPHGLVRSAWRREGNATVYEFSVPPNASADVSLADARAAGVTENATPLERIDGVTHVVEANGELRFELGAGDYRFVSENSRREASR